MPRYRYAYDRTGKIVDVIALPQERKHLNGPYICVGCEQPLIAKVSGRQKRKHFAHKVAIPSCTEETYLHKLAKHAFFQAYQECLDSGKPFHIQLLHQKECNRYNDLLDISTCERTFLVAHDLTKYYDRISLETRDNSFVPDVLLYSSLDATRKLYLEIAVTHKSSNEKIDSGVRIIEIDVASELDIERIWTCDIKWHEAQFYNFTPQPLVNDICSCASENHLCLIVYLSGKSYMLNQPLERISDELKRRRSEIMHYEIASVPTNAPPANRGYIFVRLVNNAYQQGIAVRNCFVCRHAGSNWSAYNRSPIYCRLLRQRCGSNEAATCPHFKYKPI